MREQPICPLPQCRKDISGGQAIRMRMLEQVAAQFCALAPPRGLVRPRIWLGSATVTFDLTADGQTNRRAMGAASARVPAAQPRRPSRLIGESEEINRIRRYTRKVANSDITTMITGPTGSGKEVVALELHDQSRRAKGPLVALNCAAIPDELLEGELFGYEKGAYTGATKSYPGKLKLADKGTLFLDEIGELSPVGQAKLLRALETGEVYALGSHQPTTFDIRIICATNRDLHAEMGAGRFRSDLYYRIAVAKISLSAMSERRADILPIAQHFCRQMSGDQSARLHFSPDAKKAMLAYHWPGNARELRNCVELLTLTCDGAEIQPSDLPEYVQYNARQIAKVSAPQHCESGDERSQLLEALRLSDGNKSKAAELLNCSRMTLYRKLAKIRGEQTHGLSA